MTAVRIFALLVALACFSLAGVLAARLVLFGQGDGIDVAMFVVLMMWAFIFLALSVPKKGISDRE